MFGAAAAAANYRLLVTCSMTIVFFSESDDLIIAIPNSARRNQSIWCYIDSTSEQSNQNHDLDIMILDRRAASLQNVVCRPK